MSLLLIRQLLLLLALLPLRPSLAQSVDAAGVMPPPTELASITPWFGGPPPTDPEVVADLRRRAEVVAAAIEMQDRSIRTLEWSQRCWGRRHGKPTRVLTDADEMAFDEHGRWLLRGRHGIRQPGTDDLFMHPVWYAYDGEFMRAMSELNQPPSGNVRRHTEEFLAWPSLEHLLGRRMTLNQVSLAEVVRRAPIIHDVTDDGNKRMTAVIEGRIWSQWYNWCVLRVTVDVDAPPRLISIFLYDPLTGRPRVIDRTDRFEVHDGIAIPTGGDRLLFIEAAEELLTPEVRDRLAALQRHLDDLPPQPSHVDPATAEAAMARAAQTARMRALTREIMGPGGVPFTQIDEDERYVEVTAIRSVNQRLPVERFRIEFPPGALIADEARDIRYTVGEPGDPALQGDRAAGDHP